MTRLEAFLAGVWEFVVGDDWRVALGVVLAIGVVALFGAASISAWWVMPPAVIALLGFSIDRAVRGL